MNLRLWKTKFESLPSKWSKDQQEGAGTDVKKYKKMLKNIKEKIAELEKKIKDQDDAGPSGEKH